MVRYALESAGRQRKTDFVPLIVPHLARAATRETAGQALLAFGDRIAGTLQDYLADPEEPAAVRGALPEILSRMGTPRAAAALVRELRKGTKASGRPSSRPSPASVPATPPSPSGPRTSSRRFSPASGSRAKP